MLESIIVYVTLALVMISCGIIASLRESRQQYKSAVYQLLFDTATYDPGKLRVKSSYSYFAPEIIILILAFSFVFGFRYGVGVDYFHYVRNYLSEEGREFEAIFLFVSNLLSQNNVHYSFFFLIWAFIQISLIIYTFKDQRYILPYLAFFLIFGTFYLSMMNIIRQQVAACIFLASVQFIDKRKPLLFYLSVLISFFIHKSAVLLIVVYPILRYKSDWFRSIKWQLLFFAVAVFLSKNYDLVVSLIEIPFKFAASAMGFSNYSLGVLTNAILNDRSQFGSNTGFGIYTQFIRYLPIILYSRKMKEYYNSSFFNMMYTMWFVSILTDFVFGSSIILTRPFVFVINQRFIMLAYFAHFCVVGKSVLKKVIIAIIVLLHFLLFMNMMSNGVVNTTAFTFVWQH